MNQIPTLASGLASPSGETPLTNIPKAVNSENTAVFQIPSSPGSPQGSSPKGKIAGSLVALQSLLTSSIKGGNAQKLVPVLTSNVRNDLTQLTTANPNTSTAITTTLVSTGIIASIPQGDISVLPSAKPSLIPASNSTGNQKSGAEKSIPQVVTAMPGTSTTAKKTVTKPSVVPTSKEGASNLVSKEQSKSTTSDKSELPGKSSQQTKRSSAQPQSHENSTAKSPVIRVNNGNFVRMRSSSGGLTQLHPASAKSIDAQSIKAPNTTPLHTQPNAKNNVAIKLPTSEITVPKKASVSSIIVPVLPTNKNLSALPTKLVDFTSAEKTISLTDAHKNNTGENKEGSGARANSGSTSPNLPKISTPSIPTTKTINAQQPNTATKSDDISTTQSKTLKSNIGSNKNGKLQLPESSAHAVKSPRAAQSHPNLNITTDKLLPLTKIVIPSSDSVSAQPNTKPISSTRATDNKEVSDTINSIVKQGPTVASTIPQASTTKDSSKHAATPANSPLNKESALGSTPGNNQKPVLTPLNKASIKDNLINEAVATLKPINPGKTVTDKNVSINVASNIPTSTNNNALNTDVAPSDSSNQNISIHNTQATDSSVIQYKSSSNKSQKTSTEKTSNTDTQISQSKTVVTPTGTPESAVNTIAGAATQTEKGIHRVGDTKNAREVEQKPPSTISNRSIPTGNRENTGSPASPTIESEKIASNDENQSTVLPRIKDSSITIAVTPTKSATLSNLKKVKSEANSILKTDIDVNTAKIQKSKTSLNSNDSQTSEKLPSKHHTKVANISPVEVTNDLKPSVEAVHVAKPEPITELVRTSTKKVGSLRLKPDVDSNAVTIDNGARTSINPNTGSNLKSANPTEHHSSNRVVHNQLPSVSVVQNDKNTDTEHSKTNIEKVHTSTPVAKTALIANQVAPLGKPETNSTDNADKSIFHKILKAVQGKGSKSKNTDQVLSKSRASTRLPLQIENSPKPIHNEPIPEAAKVLQSKPLLRTDTTTEISTPSGNTVKLSGGQIFLNSSQSPQAKLTTVKNSSNANAASLDSTSNVNTKDSGLHSKISSNPESVSDKFKSNPLLNPAQSQANSIIRGEKANSSLPANTEQKIVKSTAVSRPQNPVIDRITTESQSRKGKPALKKASARLDILTTKGRNIKPTGNTPAQNSSTIPQQNVSTGKASDTILNTIPTTEGKADSTVNRLNENSKVSLQPNTKLNPVKTNLPIRPELQNVTNVKPVSNKSIAAVEHSLKAKNIVDIPSAHGSKPVINKGATSVEQSLKAKNTVEIQSAPGLRLPTRTKNQPIANQNPTNTGEKPQSVTTYSENSVKPSILISETPTKLNLIAPESNAVGKSKKVTVQIDPKHQTIRIVDRQKPTSPLKGVNTGTTQLLNSEQKPEIISPAHPRMTKPVAINPDQARSERFISASQSTNVKNISDSNASLGLNNSKDRTTVANTVNVVEGKPIIPFQKSNTPIGPQDMSLPQRKPSIVAEADKTAISRVADDKSTEGVVKNVENPGSDQKRTARSVASTKQIADISPTVFDNTVKQREIISGEHSSAFKLQKEETTIPGFLKNLLSIEVEKLIKAQNTTGTADANKQNIMPGTQQKSLPRGKIRRLGSQDNRAANPVSARPVGELNYGARQNSSSNNMPDSGKFVKNSFGFNHGEESAIAGAISSTEIGLTSSTNVAKYSDGADSSQNSTTNLSEPILKMIERLRQSRNSSLKISLSLSQGRSMTMKLQVRPGRVHAQFLTDSVEIKQGLTDGWEKITKAAAEQGIQLASPKIEYRPKFSRTQISVNRLKHAMENTEDTSDMQVAFTDSSLDDHNSQQNNRENAHGKNETTLWA